MIKIPRLAVAFVEIKGITGKFKSSMAQANRITNKFGSSATKSIRRVTLGLAAMGVAAGVAAIAIGVKLAQALTRVARAVITTAVKYDKLKLGLTAVAGSAEEAEKQLTRLQEVAKLPGLSFAEAIQGSTALQAAGLNAQLAERSLKAFGNALVTVGKGAADLKGVNLALTQIVTKGAGFGQELRQLSERLPQVRKAMKDAFGISSVEDFKKLGLSAEQFIEGIVLEFEKLPKVTGTVANDIENLGIAFDRLKDEIGQKLLGATSDVATSLTGIVDKLRLVVEHYKSYRAEATKIFIEVAKTGLRITNAMLAAIAKSIAIVSQKMWKPMIDSFKLAINKELNKELKFGLGTDIDALKPFFETLNKGIQKGFDGIRATIMDPKEQAKLRKSIDDGLGPALTDSLAGVEKVLAATIKEILGDLSTLDAEIGAFVNTLPVDKIENTADAFFDISKAVGNLNLNFQTFSGFTKTFGQFRIEQFGSQLAAAFGNIGKMSDTAKEKMQAFWDAQQERAQRAVDTIRPAFENMFADLLGGNTKNLWERFWDDLKRIAISKMASIFAGQLLGGLFSGGGGIGALLAGGSLLAGLGPLAPALAAAAPVVGGIASQVGGFLEGGQSNTFVFNQTDFANMDPVRLAKTASQQIAPALAEEAVDGR